MTTLFLFLAQATNELPSWLQALERLGSFALIAFLIYYFVKVALPQQRQDYLAATTEARKDHLASETQARGDYLAARREDHVVLMKIAEATQKNAEATMVHVSQANMVWEKQGILTPKH